MAKFVMCSVFDAAVKAFSQPFFVRTREEAHRSFVDAVNDPKLEFGKHPNDYTLFQLGTFDDSGELECIRPDVIVAARDVIATVS